ncbi:MAG TPA: hypothetical protein PLJ78_17315 [Anaerolineae bacterium]|nr:hypothetical protein [Anaerolineae bacterium]HQK15691.1 hypothetical protein [Anaerolineae bacterium]
MKLSPYVLTFSTFIAAGALALGYALNAQPLIALFFVALGLLWLVAQRYKWLPAASLGLLGVTIGAVLGTWYGVKSGWLLVSVTAGLAAWDLHHFIQHLQTSENPENVRALERAHVWRLGGVVGVGLLLGTLALTIRLTLRFGVILILMWLAFFGLSRLIHYLRQESD